MSRALTILSGTWPNGSGAVEVAGPPDLEDRIAIVLGHVAVAAGAPPPLARPGGSLMLLCRAEDADELRGAVCRALQGLR